MSIADRQPNGAALIVLKPIHAFFHQGSPYTLLSECGVDKQGVNLSFQICVKC